VRWNEYRQRTVTLPQACFDGDVKFLYLGNTNLSPVYSQISIVSPLSTVRLLTEVHVYPKHNSFLGRYIALVKY
jgi:hypothetical protein